MTSRSTLCRASARRVRLLSSAFGGVSTVLIAFFILCRPTHLVGSSNRAMLWDGGYGKTVPGRSLTNAVAIAAMLKSMGITVEELPDYDEGVTECLEHAYATIRETGAPYALMVRKAVKKTERTKTNPHRLPHCLLRQFVGDSPQVVGVVLRRSRSTRCNRSRRTRPAPK